jgi:hypothetical protein
MLAVERGGNPVGVSSEVGITLEKSHQLLEIVDIVDKAGVVVGELQNGLPDLALVLLDSVGSSWLESLTTEDAGSFVPRILFPATGAIDGCNRIRLFDFDIGAVDSGELFVGVLAENTDVPAGNVASVLPSVVLLNVRLIHSTRGQIGSTRLPEIPEVTGFEIPARSLRIFRYIYYVGSSGVLSVEHCGASSSFRGGWAANYQSR